MITTLFKLKRAFRRKPRPKIIITLTLKGITIWN